MFLDKSTN